MSALQIRKPSFAKVDGHQILRSLCCHQLDLWAQQNNGSLPVQDKRQHGGYLRVKQQQSPAFCVPCTAHTHPSARWLSEHSARSKAHNNRQQWTIIGSCGPGVCTSGEHGHVPETRLHSLRRRQAGEVARRSRHLRKDLPAPTVFTGSHAKRV